MKADIHPDYHEITVVMTNGTEFKTRSCYGKPGEKLVLDVDISTHPAWNKGADMELKNKGQNEKFRNRYGNFDFSKKKGAAETAAPAAKEAAPKAAEGDAA